VTWTRTPRSAEADLKDPDALRVSLRQLDDELRSAEAEFQNLARELAQKALDGKGVNGGMDAAYAESLRHRNANSGGSHSAYADNHPCGEEPDLPPFEVPLTSRQKKYDAYLKAARVPLDARRFEELVEQAKQLLRLDVEKVVPALCRAYRTLVAQHAECVPSETDVLQEVIDARRRAETAVDSAADASP
jgi:hypothetical protein